MTHAFCPECDSRLSLGSNPEEGQAVKCSSCGAKLMVADTAPLELDWAYDEDEFEMDIEFADDFDEDYDVHFDEYDEELSDI